MSSASRAGKRQKKRSHLPYGWRVDRSPGPEHDRHKSISCAESVARTTGECRALAVLEKDKKNEATCLMDGAWTGHPDQNTIAINQFPAPNQLRERPANVERYPYLRPEPCWKKTKKTKPPALWMARGPVTRTRTRSP